MSMALPLLESQHFARSRPISSQQNPGAGSATSEHTQTRADVHSAPVILHNTSLITETESLLSTEEHGELLQSVMTTAELPNLTGEEVEMNLPHAEETVVKERVIPLNVIKGRYLVKQATRPPATQLVSCTSSESQLVEHSRGGNIQDRPAAEGVVTSSPNVVGTNKSNQPVQSRATSAQHVLEPSVVASHTATSSAARTESRQTYGERRGSPRPCHTSRSTRSRSPERERFGYPRRDARWEHSSRSPRRVEHRATPRPSPGRRAPLERGRDESRRDDSHNREGQPVSDDGMKNIVMAFLDFYHQSRD